MQANDALHNQYDLARSGLHCAAVVGWGSVPDASLRTIRAELIVRIDSRLRHLPQGDYDMNNITNHNQALTATVHRYVSQHGQSFSEISAAAPVLLIFLRHLQCPFCRSMLQAVSTQRKDIEERGIAIAFVHMAKESEARKLLAYFKLADLPRFSDQSRELYRLAGLRTLKLRSLFDYNVLRQGWKAKRDLRDAPRARGGSLLQMPGVFLIDQGHVLAGESLLHYDHAFDWLSFLNAA